MTNEDFKPCPLCRGKVIAKQSKSGGFYAVCTNPRCIMSYGIRSIFANKRDLIWAWNRGRIGRE